MYIGKYCHDYLELYHLSINKTEFIKREPVLTFYIISIKNKGNTKARVLRKFSPNPRQIFYQEMPVYVLQRQFYHIK